MKRRGFPLAYPMEILIATEPLIGKYTFEIKGVCNLCNKTEKE
ncbi:hypothetical protein [Desulfosporosinus nitroreducens]|nr:hypothetical protein [Desulfosporosinus nitroreducens]